MLPIETCIDKFNKKHGKKNPQDAQNVTVQWEVHIHRVRFSSAARSNITKPPRVKSS